MLIQQVDVIGLEPLQGSIHDLLNMVGTTVQPVGLVARERKSELRGDRHLIAAVFQAAPQQLLVHRFHETYHMSEILFGSDAV
jgi:hypothetical protein